MAASWPADLSCLRVDLDRVDESPYSDGVQYGRSHFLALGNGAFQRIAERAPSLRLRSISYVRIVAAAGIGFRCIYGCARNR